MKNWFYEKNTYLLNHDVNKTFEEVLWMTNDEFRQWCIDLRKVIVYAWDELGIPPRVGYNKDEIIDQFQKMESFPVHEFLVKDELTGEQNVIRNTSNIGNAVNQFFETMMKVRINYTKNVEDGKSIYDYFARDDLLDTFVTYASRHFKRDSFYHYSNPIKVMDRDYGEDLPMHTDSVNWLHDFEKNYRSRGKYDYWLCPVKDKEYTGYNEELKNKTYLQISYDEIMKNKHVISEKCMTNVDKKRSEIYQIRVFKYGQKLFPIGLKAFRVSFCQYAVNFPPLTAKFLYERYTDHIKKQECIKIYDPSMGWAGRLLGALSVTDDRCIHYIGTDPNSDHGTAPGRTKYNEVADFYRNNVRKGGLWEIDHNTTEFYQLGSEVISNHISPDHWGDVDLVFTSPPYFAKEAYSEDPEQSYKKFSAYDSWKEGFLKPTLETAVKLLKSNRYLLWNIADAKFGQDMLPLEEDSNIILRSLGMEFKGVMKMALAQMPGGNRIDTETGLPKAKNFVKINGMFLKYEPILIYWKP